MPRGWPPRPPSASRRSPRAEPATSARLRRARRCSPRRRPHPATSRRPARRRRPRGRPPPGRPSRVRRRLREEHRHRHDGASASACAQGPPATLCRVPAGVTAEQVVLVDSAGGGATVRACRRAAGGYRTELGPYDGHVGRNGVSAAKREGDLRTPAGVFPSAEASAPTPTRASGWARGCRWMPRTCGSTTRLVALQHPPAHPGERPVGQCREAAQPAGVQLRAGHRVQRGAHARHRARRSSCTSTRGPAPRVRVLPTEPLLAVMRWGAQEPSSPSADRWDRSGREPGEPAE